MVLFYFSGTGNSKYIANLFCRRMGAKCYSIEEDVDFHKVLAQEETIGFCYPIYGSRMPRIMREFAQRHSDGLRNKKVIIFCTQWMFSGDGARSFTDLFPRGHFDVSYAWHFRMPNNVCNLAILPIESQEKIKWYQARAKREMKTVCRHIQNGVVKRRGFNIGSQALGMMQGAFMPKLEKRGQGAFWTNETCTLCGLCVSICPMKNLENTGAKIAHKNNCTLCYRCVNRCPHQAIELFMHKKITKQYKGLKSLQT